MLFRPAKDILELNLAKNLVVALQTKVAFAYWRIVPSVFLSDITCIRSIDPDSCIHVVFCSTLPFKVLPFRCVILTYPCLHVTPQHMFNSSLR
jgi:hypothetical protein